MAIVTLTPPQHQIRTLGVLAYVDEAERQRIQELPSGYRATALTNLLKELERAKKRGRI